ncbi:hypothetical protein CC80DRAFT_7963 [Byssothecium circinans]|uniref:Cleavage and polyadenylation specificity factor subunit 2 n=1 Tax=Byssothecium circinans TaxID=147558 RepID=A0A6A5UF26_9PLEO|nr:hypothetical protein CC80DRAFT_7963 [Byssothecium circinans]
MFHLTPLLGAQSASPASQSLLEFDGGVKVLIDVGWDESFDAEQLKELEKHVPTLSFILLTHATIAHLGAFVHCCKHFPLFTRIPIYATKPVISLGRTLLQDVYESTPLACSIIPADALAESSSPFLMQAPTPEEIATYFGLIKALKYVQPHQPLPSPFSPPLGGLTVTAYGAGHTLGGTIWHIEHNVDSVVYAVDWNQAKEHVLPGAAWLAGGSEVVEKLRRPTAMICSSRGSTAVSRQTDKRDEALLSMIRDTVAKGGSVLIPSDSSARMLELSYLLEDAWQKETVKDDSSSPLKNARLYLASRTGGATMRYARSMLEWMEEGIAKEFETATGAQEGQDQRRHRGQQAGAKGDDEKPKAPFDFRHITLLERKSQVSRMLGATEPRVILASDTSLEWGFSKDAVRSLASDERNLIILTERIGEFDGQQKGVGRYLWDLWNERNTSPEQDPLAAIVSASGDQVALQSSRAAALEGNELALYQQYLITQQQLQNTSGTALESYALEDDRFSSSSSESSDDSESGLQGKALNTAALLRHARRKLGLSDEELGPKILIERKGVYDYYTRDKRGKQARFPHVYRPRPTDDYGGLIRPKDYIRADEDEQIISERHETTKEDAVDQEKQWTVQADKPEDDPDRIEGPLKVVVATELLLLKCRIAFVDFSGLHDRRTIQMMMPLIKPRKLILVAGDEAETNSLAEDCRKVLNAGSGDAANAVDVFTPTIGMVVDASVDTNAWSVKLSRDMVRQLQWQKVRELSVAPITGRLAAVSLQPNVKNEDGATKKKPKLDATVALVSDKMDTTPVLDVVPSHLSTAVRSVAQPFHVGDLRLADLRKLMQSSGLRAEFRGEGVLTINDIVTVRKTATGKSEIDGGVYSFTDPKQSATFAQVKKQIYEALAVVEGA